MNCVCFFFPRADPRHNDLDRPASAAPISYTTCQVDDGRLQKQKTMLTIAHTATQRLVDPESISGRVLDEPGGARGAQRSSPIECLRDRHFLSCATER